MRRVYLYLLIFAMGVLNSLVITYFVVKYSPSNRQRRNYLSDEHFLQVRDESVYSLVSGRSKNGKTPQRKIDKDRSSIEGKCPLDYKFLALAEPLIVYHLVCLDQTEALNTIRVALELSGQDKSDKALRLFQHALALAPEHPEVLNKYGEYLEHSQADIITADLMYYQVRIGYVSIIALVRAFVYDIERSTASLYYNIITKSDRFFFLVAVGLIAKSKA